MVAPVYNSIYDLDNNGTINTTDIQLAEAQSVSIPDDVVRAVQETGEISQQANTQNENLTADQLRSLISAEEAIIAQYRADISNADTEIATLKQEKVALENQRKEFQANFNSQSGQLLEMKSDLSAIMINALSQSETISGEHAKVVNNTISQAIFDYSMGEYEGQELKDVINFKLNSVGFDTSIINKLINNGDALGARILAKCEVVENIVGDIRGINNKIGLIDDKISGLEALKNNATKGIAESEVKIKNWQDKLDAIIAEEQKKKDPIGFKADGATFDFVIDRDNDGIFDGSNEFLGAQNGWAEISQYDDNKDGVIAGDELADMTILKTSANGEKTFVNASESGINEIDLKSHTKTNEDIGNDNLLIGKFDLTYNNKNVEGYQTLDTESYLEKTYGDAYGKNINNTQQQVETVSKVVNPFSVPESNAKSIASMAMTTLDLTKNKINNTLDDAEREKEDYYIPVEVENMNKKEDNEEENNKKKKLENK